MMEGIRIIDLPACQMATSENRGLEAFNDWFTEADRQRNDKFFPRDFMWFDAEHRNMVWYYALEDPSSYTGGFDVVDFEGGLYAAAISIDEDDASGNRVYASIKKWIASSGVFVLDERPRRYTMFHIITSDRAYSAMGYRQLDIFVPIKEKQEETVSPSS